MNLYKLRFFQNVIVYQCSKIKYYNTKWPPLSLKHQNSPGEKEINLKRAILSSTNSSGVYKFNSSNNVLASMISITNKTLNFIGKQISNKVPGPAEEIKTIFDFLCKALWNVLTWKERKLAKLKLAPISVQEPRTVVQRFLFSQVIFLKEKTCMKKKRESLYLFT